MAEYEKIGKMCLTNQGGFVAKMHFLHGSALDQMHRVNGSKKDITLGCSETQDPGNFGVQEGDICTIYADVAAGSDKEGKVYFIYEKGNANKANFSISGTTLSNHLGFVDISQT